jgi:hypothetical protein
VFERIEGFREESTAATTLGTEVHAEIEEWIKNGTFPKHPVTKKWLAMFSDHPHFPSKETSASEEEFRLHIQGVNWLGYTDWRRAGDAPSHRIVGDAKTTNDLKWALRESGGLLVDADGKIDPQSTLYATREFCEGAETVTGHWAYIQSKAPFTTRLVECNFDRQATEAAYATMHGHAQEMNELYAIRPKANDVPYRASYCNAFNRPCGQAERCTKARGVFQSDPLNLDNNQELSMRNFLDSIRNSALALETDDAPPPPPVDDEAPPAPPADEEPAAPEGWAAVEAAGELDEAPPAPPEEEELEAEKLVAEYLAARRPARPAPATVEAGFINAPEAAGKAPYATPEAAAEGEGVEPVVVVEKPVKAPKAKKVKAAKVEVVEVPAFVAEPQDVFVAEEAPMSFVAAPVVQQPTDPGVFYHSDLRTTLERIEAKLDRLLAPR